MKKIIEIAMNFDDIRVVNEGLNLQLSKELLHHICLTDLSLGDYLYRVNAARLSLES